jgi:hypothetical protein
MLRSIEIVCSKAIIVKPSRYPDLSSVSPGRGQADATN